jgi:hypothetical protein
MHGFILHGNQNIPHNWTHDVVGEVDDLQTQLGMNRQDM